MTLFVLDEGSGLGTGNVGLVDGLTWRLLSVDDWGVDSAMVIHGFG
jgi:hypothetical protein